MLMDSERARWIKSTSQDTGVIILSSGDLPRYIIESIGTRIGDWDQVAYLHIPHPTQLEQEWFQVETAAHDPHMPSACEAGELLGAIPKTCHLLDIETGPAVRLTWLGSVCGHKLHLFGLTASQETAAMDAQVEEILAATRHLVKDYLQEHFLSPA